MWPWKMLKVEGVEGQHCPFWALERAVQPLEKRPGKQILVAVGYECGNPNHPFPPVKLTPRVVKRIETAR